ncbi:hypothetical protein [Salinisphaera sp.]|uniref:hypothetical protein n=1 Tax=Salinisphaera sp. TaxID=1914330 RepID=UPI002D775B2B|nr:hypothetical protein [Salinisphaera sp.]HET7313664.1 hypothetical protein [Salinisphaera sp.]
MNGGYGRGDDPDAGDRLHREEQGAGGGHTRNDSTPGFDRDQAEREARDAIGNARDELQSLLENQKNVAAEQVRAMAEALRGTADELNRKDQHTVATYVGHVAERIDYWSDRFRQRHIDELARDIQNLANRQPGLFIAGAVVVGFAATRFLRSTAGDRGYRSGQTDHTGEAASAHTASNAEPANPRDTTAGYEHRAAAPRTVENETRSARSFSSPGGGPGGPDRRPPVDARTDRTVDLDITLY